ncbi:hypothetical protein [Mesorhizobium silamurunense]|nr:hypothetical protein [Mesorhizobium silamurunense]
MRYPAAMRRCGTRPPNKKFDRRSKEIYKKCVDIFLTGLCYLRAQARP